MQNYIKIFQEESKYLLNSYKDKDLNAVERCQKVFGNRTDLSLMNMQHVIAKEYGFNQWNDLRSASNSEQAQALTIKKGGNFTSPLTKWFNQNTIIPEAEDGHSKLRTEDKTIDWENFTLARPFDSIDLSFMDVSGKNLSKLNLLDASFTDATIWPKNKEFLPKGINPEKFLEERKDSGLGIKALHKAGIKGKGRNIVLISEAGLGDHIEYHHNLMDYIEISDEKPMGGFRGNTDASGLVGKTCGLAPEAYLYVISVGRCGRSFLKYAQAIQKACEIHQNLIKNHQNGIDVIERLWRAIQKIFKINIQYWRNYSRFNNSKCLKCKYVALCGGGCVASAFFRHKRLGNIDEHCCRWIKYIMSNNFDPKNYLVKGEQC